MAEPAPRVDGAPAAEDPPSKGSAIELAGLVVAATTFITALAFYFGWAITTSNVAYFGIDSSALGFSTQDYVLRSTDALFVPLGTMVVLALGAISIHAGVEHWLADPRRRPLLRHLARLGVVAGGALLALGLWEAIKHLPIWPSYLLPPASPGIGIAVLAYSVRVRALANAADGRAGSAPRTAARPRRLAVMLVWLLVVLSAFWTAAVFAAALGRGRAQELAANLRGRPAVTVFSPRRLHLEGPGVTLSRLAGGDSAYRYQYSGLRLLIRGGDKYFLVPEQWRPGAGRAIVLVDEPPLRFEFGSNPRQRVLRR